MKVNLCFCIFRLIKEKSSSDAMLIELHKEVERMRTENSILSSTKKANGYHNISASSLSLESNASSEPFRIEELQHELDQMKKRNRHLEESNEELQAMMLTKSIEEGRNLLNGGTSNLADELKEMGQQQVRNNTINS